MVLFSFKNAKQLRGKGKLKACQESTRRGGGRRRKRNKPRGKKNRIRLDYRAAHHRFRRVVGGLASAADWLLVFINQ